MHHRALVVGAGSIGQRHGRNLRQIGVGLLAVCDPDTGRLNEVAAELGVQCFTDVAQAIEHMQPSVVLICTPPVLHGAQAQAALAHGAHVFVEKPLSHHLEGVDELIALAKQRQRVVQVGYNLRFHPGVVTLKQQLEDGVIGRVLHAQAEFGQYLPDWRPWQNYRESYSAQRTMGGGVILDVSHELDYILWLLGMPKSVIAMAGTAGDLEIDVEDSATILLGYERGVHASVHLDLLQRAYTRTCKIVGTRGTLVWDYGAQQVGRFDASTHEWTTFECRIDSNAMYLAELEHFFTCIERGSAPLVDLEQGKQVLQLALLAQRSAFEGCIQVLP